MSYDHHLDARACAAFRKQEPCHLRGWRKVWSWLRSHPLARVRRNLATARRIREQPIAHTSIPTFEDWLATSAWKPLYDRYANRGVLSREGVRQEIERVDRLIEEYHE